MPSFEITKDESRQIALIADRAVELAAAQGVQCAKLYIVMDITACHANGCRLDLGRLLAADDFNLAHDVFGIRHHLDRATGKLTDHFSPRFASALEAQP